MRKSSGFSMVELMIVVVIIAILAAIAIPSYRSYVVRGNRTEATKDLSDLASRQERYYYSNNAYADTLAGLNADSLTPKNYALSVVASAVSVAPATYTLTATAVHAQAADDALCQSISLDNFGRWASTGSSANDPKCWGNR